MKEVFLPGSNRRRTGSRVTGVSSNARRWAGAKVETGIYFVMADDPFQPLGALLSSHCCEVDEVSHAM